MNEYIIYIISEGFWGFGVTVKAILAKIVEMVTEVEKIEFSKRMIYFKSFKFES